MRGMLAAALLVSLLPIGGASAQSSGSPGATSAGIGWSAATSIPGMSGTTYGYACSGNTETIIGSSELPPPDDPVKLLKWRWEQIAEHRRVDQETVVGEMHATTPDADRMKRATAEIAKDAQAMIAIQGALAKLSSPKRGI